MTHEEALYRVKGYLTDIIPTEDYSEVEEIIKALDQQPVTTTNNDEPITIIYPTIVCDDAISREELLKAIDTWDKFGYTETGCFVRITKEIDNYVPYVHLEDVITAIQKLPPVTSQQKYGKWIGHREHCEDLGVLPSGLGAYEWCSSCDCGIDVREWHRNNYNYCPNCGAKMVEPQESEE